jgi:RNA polymerase sigma-70 factor (sigma-E family)
VPGDPGDDERDFLAYARSRQEALRRSAYLLCRDAHQADDLVQTTLTRLFLRWRRIRGADNPDAYAHTVLVRVFLDEQRRGWWRVLLPGRLPDQPLPDAAAHSDTRLLVRQALHRLTPRQRAVLVLRFYQDLPVEQAAEALGCTTGTVKSQTNRALAALRRALEAAGVAGAPLLEELTS